MDKKLTPWFSSDVKPVHVGIYQRQHGKEYFAYWDGSQWSAYHTEISDAIKYRDCGTIYAYLPWRGLASKP